MASASGRSSDQPDLDGLRHATRRARGTSPVTLTGAAVRHLFLGPYRPIVAALAAAPGNQDRTAVDRGLERDRSDGRAEEAL